MPRKVKLPEGFKPDDASLWEKRPTQTIVRTYRLVTPLFGGGVEHRRADPVITVRPSEIKGQLRFWWRAVRGWRGKGNLSKLLESEEEIWGGVSKSKSASKVTLRVKVLDSGRAEEPFVRVPGKKFPKNKHHIAPGYFAFPLQPTKEDPTIYPVRVGVRFELALSLPSAYEEEVRAALWAWETFGGIGARTRRGFGAVVPEDFNPPSIEQIRHRLSDLIEDDAWPDGVPHLRPESPFFLYPGSWQNLAEAYKNFRQWRNGQRGRSKWPEPDEIRRITRKNSPGHEPRHPVHKFPRGRFGLPIVFHFKDDKKGDPPDTTLKGQGFERLASPLGFKPFGEKGPVLVYVLEDNRKLPGPYILDTPWGPKPASVDLTPEEASLIEPLAAAGGETDPVLAFIEWLKQGGRK